MHIHTLHRWKHSHRFNVEDTPGEPNTRRLSVWLHGSAGRPADFSAGNCGVVRGQGLSWIWMDPIMSIVGALIISRWSYGLLIDSGRVLVDRGVNPEAVEEIRSIIEADSDNRVSDIHVWRVSTHHLSAIVSIVTH